MGSVRINETGNVYGKLTVEEYHHHTSTKTSGGKKRAIAYWRCRCECGEHSVVAGADLRRRDGKAVRMCRTCQRTKHGHTKRNWQSSTYVAWHSMVSRCTTPSYDGYARYGARGVKVCKRWLRFENFLADMGERPSPKHTIDRKDGAGDYEPSNCRWATKAEQNRNMRTNVLVTIGGETKTLTDWLVHYGRRPQTYYYRRRRGMSIEDAIATPPGPSSRRR